MNLKITVLCLCLLIASQAFAQSPQTSGKCGDNVYWEITGDSLILSGKGKASIYTERGAPWKRYKDQIKHIVIKDGVTDLGIHLFFDCNACTSVNIANSVQRIGAYAFAGCENIEEIIIPEGVTELADLAVFDRCTNLKHIHIPASTMKLSGLSFGNCPNLMRIDISGDNPKFTSVDNAIYSKDSTSLIYVNSGRRGSFVIPSNVGRVESTAFHDCYKITSLTIPQSIWYFNRGAFAVNLAEIYNLSPLYMAKTSEQKKSRRRYSHRKYKEFFECLTVDVESIHKSADEKSIVEHVGDFMFCGDELICYLGSDSVVELPQDHNGKRYSIAKNAFKNQYYISDITIPESVDSIGYRAFYGCTKLRRLSLPGNVKSIGEEAFYKCTGLTQLLISEGTKSIGQQAFYECTGLKRLSIPGSVKSIGERAFYGCTGLAQLLLYEGISNIGQWAFERCYKLKAVNIPSSVKSIGMNPFAACTSLENIKVAPHNKWFDSRDECNAIIRTKTNSLAAGCAATIIPSSVTFISACAFDGCDRLKIVVLPEGLRGIGYSAFANTVNLTEVHLPASLKRIGEYAFQGCSGLQSVTLNEGLEEIGTCAFSKATSLKEITIPASVKKIYGHAFEGCSCLKRINIHPTTLVSPVAFGNEWWLD